MNLRKNTADISQKRMLSEKEAQVYLGLGRTRTRELGKEINAVMHIGSRILYDKVILDEFLDQNRGQQYGENYMSKGLQEQRITGVKDGYKI